MDSEELRYESLTDALVAVSDDLAPGLQALRRLYEPEPVPPHVAYGDVLGPWMRDGLARGSRSTETIQPQLAAAWSLLESMMHATDERIAEVAALSVLEQLAFDPALRHRLPAGAGPASARFIRATWERNPRLHD